MGIAVDGAGNIYVAQKGADQITVVLNQSGSYTQETLTDNGSQELNFPTALALNGNGDVYVVESGSQHAAPRRAPTWLFV